MNTKTELISVIVLSYNSENTIIDTLESIRAQTYSTVELIIADDHSTDLTRLIAEQWQEEYKNHFCRVIITPDHENYGISRNLNYAVRFANGTWIKIIAADDILMPDCLARCVYAKNSREECKCFQGKEYIINENCEIIGELLIDSYRMKKVAGFSSVLSQYYYFLKDDIKLSPSLFFERAAFNSFGGCDENFKNIEDYPLKLRFLLNGFRIGYVDYYIVKYRVHNSISRDSKKCYQVQHYRLKEEIKKKYCYPNLKIWHLSYWLAELNEALTFNIVLRVFKNENKIYTRLFIRLISFFNPRAIRSRIDGFFATHMDK